MADPILHPVQLVGAGPGPVDLLTIRALRVIQGAEALLFDALVQPDVIALAPGRCLKIQTGKRSGRTSMTQSTINRLMIRLARRGLNVVRLKGGDPSIFGRVGEEVDALEAAGLACEIVPGITAASAAAAQLKIPLTHREVARNVTFMTARLADGQVNLAIADQCRARGSTLAIYMGRDQARLLSDQLIERGWWADTPALAIENAGAQDARHWTGTLASLAAMLERARPDGPVLLLIGEVVRRCRSIESLAAEPAAGLREPNRNMA